MAQRNEADRPGADPASTPADADAPPAAPPDVPEAFEHCLERLEALVDHLEDGELPLEEALAAFEEGVALTRHCAAQLERAERRIDVLAKQGRGWMERPFEADGEDD